MTALAVRPGTGQGSSERRLPPTFWVASSKGVARMEPTIAETAGDRAWHVPAVVTSEQLVRNYVSALWAEDWDSPEDAVYDTW